MAPKGGSLIEFKSLLPNSVPQARGVGPEAWACLPGQGLRYLEHLCLVLEQMVRLQQLHLQLQTQRPPGVSEPCGGQAIGWASEWGRHRRVGSRHQGFLQNSLGLCSGPECPSLLCTGPCRGGRGVDPGPFTSTLSCPRR